MCDLWVDWSTDKDSDSFIHCLNASFVDLSLFQTRFSFLV